MTFVMVNVNKQVKAANEWLSANPVRRFDRQGIQSEIQLSLCKHQTNSNESWAGSIRPGTKRMDLNITANKLRSPFRTFSFINIRASEVSKSPRKFSAGNEGAWTDAQKLELLHLLADKPCFSIEMSGDPVRFANKWLANQAHYGDPGKSQPHYQGMLRDFIPPVARKPEPKNTMLNGTKIPVDVYKFLYHPLEVVSPIGLVDKITERAEENEFGVRWGDAQKLALYLHILEQAERLK